MVDKSDPVLVFTAQDRCDTCGAQAYTLAHREDVPGELLFCAHHRRDHAPKLRDEGWTIIDDLAALNDLYGDLETIGG